MELSAEACAKLILAGEHLVVYGFDGIAIPLTEYKTRISIELLPEVTILFNNKPLSEKDLIIFNQDLEFYADLLSFTQVEFIELSKFSFKVDLPEMGIGLGTSASFAVAMLKLLSKFISKKLTLEELNSLAYIAEQKYHGNASGLDNTTIVYQQPILFNKKEGFTKLNFQMPSFFDNINLINSGKPKESTKEMVKYFSTKYPLLQQDYLVNLNSHIPILIQALEKNNLSQFKEVINLYGKFLESIPICTPQVAIANNLIREQNGAAKVCGAGGLTNGSGIVLSINL